MSDSENDDLSQVLGPDAVRDAIPQAGETFVIVDRSNDRALAIVDGKLRLEDDVTEDAYCYWRCVEKDGWLGFYEAELERFLGHDFWWNFVAEKSEHGEYGYFVPRAHPDGGYVLMAQRLGKLLQVVVGKDGDSLVSTAKNGTAWEFIKVDKE